MASTKHLPKEERQAIFIEMVRRGIGLRGACRQTGTSHGTLSYWRQNDEEFRDLLAEAQREAETAELIKEEALPVSIVEHPDKECQQWLIAYYRNGGVFEDACKASGLDILTVLEKLDPMSDGYDEAFAKEHERIQPVIDVKAQDAILRTIGSNSNSSSAQAWKWLEMRYPDKYGKGGSSSGDINVRINASTAFNMLKDILSDDKPLDVVGTVKELGSDRHQLAAGESGEPEVREAAPAEGGDAS